MQQSTSVPSHGTGSATIADIVGLAAERHGEQTAARFKRDGDWQELTYRELADIVSELGRGLIDRGLQAGERVALLCTTRVEWSLVDFAITSAGGVVVPIYPTNSPDECAWVISDSESRFVVVEDEVQAAKVAAVRAELPKLEDVISLSDLDALRERGRTRDTRRAGRAHRRRHARGPVHDHLHVRHHRAAEGLRAHARQLPHRHADVRGDRRHRGRPGGLPLPSARALLRAADPAAGGRSRRPAGLLERRPAADRARPDGGQAGLPAVGAAHLREDLHARHVQQRPGQDRRRDPARPEGAADAGGRAAGAGRAAGRVRQGRRGAVRQRPQHLRRQPRAGDVRRSADRQGDPRVLLRLRRARARGLRHDRDLDRHHDLHRRRPQARHGRPRDPRGRVEDRRRRRDPRTRPAHLPRLLQQRRHDLLRRDRGRLAAHRRPRLARRGRLPQHHRPQEGHHHHRGRQEPHAGQPGERPQALALDLAGGDARRPPAVPGRADHARPRGDRALRARARTGRGRGDARRASRRCTS